MSSYFTSSLTPFPCNHRLAARLIAVAIFGSLACSNHLFAQGDEALKSDKPPGKVSDIFFKAKMDNPADQYAYAQEKVDAGAQKDAITAFRHLVLKWPEAPEAPLAQLHRARLLHARGDLDDAFDEYQYLVNKYAGQFPYEEVLTSQFEIAEHAEKSRSRFLGIPAAYTPERAIPLYTAIEANAPQWKNAAKAQYRIGAIHQKNLKYEEAILAYEAVASNYSGNEFERIATFAKAECLEKLALETPNDEAASQTAWAAYDLFLQKFPQSKESEAAFEKRKEIRTRLAESQFDKALFYDKKLKNPRAARIAYRALLEDFPNSPWTEVAQARIKTITEEIE